MRSIKVLVVLAALALTTTCTGGGETVISGLWNSDNYIGGESMLERIAEELGKSEVTPKVSDDDLSRLYGTIRQRALDGDLEAALVLLKLAAEQRKEES